MATRILVLVLCAATACVTVPRDPDGTLDRVRAGTLRVGLAIREPWTAMDEAGPSGIEVSLVEGFARAHGATIRWVEGEVHDLFEALEHRRLDIVIAGLTADTPFADRVALTRPYVTTGLESQVEEHVIAVPMGENGFLVTLERFLREQRDQIGRMLGNEPS